MWSNTGVQGCSAGLQGSSGNAPFLGRLEVTGLRPRCDIQSQLEPESVKWDLGCFTLQTLNQEQLAAKFTAAEFHFPGRAVL